ncbi:hypothetical protein [Hoeflea sp.]|uniref:hypothetical protein n=1 Tax=Hoeflea sp. TaxID=1940281 RepID=UPI0019A30320|nr:hypothetical protein [Hoeflea sp.]MBC7281151.1 hypothetical protein [Hoeflea sp.]
MVTGHRWNQVDEVDRDRVVAQVRYRGCGRLGLHQMDLIETEKGIGELVITCKAYRLRQDQDMARIRASPLCSSSKFGGPASLRSALKELLRAALCLRSGEQIGRMGRVSENFRHRGSVFSERSPGFRIVVA